MPELIEEISIDPRREYLTAGRRVGFAESVDTVLAATEDDIQNELGIRIYEQMMNDPEVYKCINVLKVKTIGDGVSLLPALSENHPDYQKARIVSEFCQYALENLARPLRETLEEMLDALIYGHKIAEVIYKTSSVPGLKGEYLLLDRIKVKTFGDVRFVVDDYLNVLGFASSAGWTGAERLGAKNSEDILQSDSKIQARKADYTIKVGNEKLKFIERDKFFVLTIRGKDSDPRGRSLLRPAFNAWHLKNQVYPEYLQYLLVCAMPLLVGILPDPKTNPSVGATTTFKDQSGNTVTVNPVELMRNALLQARSSSVIAVPGGSKVEEIGVGGSGTPFYKAMEIFDEQIEAAILLQTLATSEGRHQSRATSETHMSILDELVFNIKAAMVDSLKRDVIDKLVKYNFGEDYLVYSPKITLGDTERREFSLDATAIATLYSSGFLSEDQKKYCDALLGLPIRDEQWEQFKQLSPNEVLQLYKATLEQGKLEVEIDKARQEANLNRIKQLGALKDALSITTTVVDSNGVSKPQISTPDIFSSISKEVEGLVSDIIKGSSKETSGTIDSQILDTLLRAAKSAEKMSGKKVHVTGQDDDQYAPNVSQLPDSSLTRSDSTLPGHPPEQGPNIGSQSARGSYVKQGNKGVKLSNLKNKIKDIVNFGD